MAESRHPLMIDEPPMMASVDEWRDHLRFLRELSSEYEVSALIEAAKAGLARAKERETEGVA